MSGRPVRLLTAAAIAAAASLCSRSPHASAGCYSGCGYAAPVAYTAPVVYSYSYAAPCGVRFVLRWRAAAMAAATAAATRAPMYVVNQGPTYDAPVIGATRGR